MSVSVRRFCCAVCVRGFGVQYTEKFYKLSKEIMALDGVVHYDMIHLDCDDIKHELSALATSLGQSVHEKLAVTNRTENARYWKPSLEVAPAHVDAAGWTGWAIAYPTFKSGELLCDRFHQ